MTYIKVFVDYLDAIEPLGDAERGRLFTALLEYAKTGEAPQLGGNERFIFPMMKSQLDRDMAANEELSSKRRAAGKSRQQLSANATNCQQMLTNEANATKCLQDKDKDKDKDKDYISNPFIMFPLKNGGFHAVDETMVARLSELYPSVDVRQALRNMRGWLDANPTKRKTAAGINRFIYGWLRSEQNEAGRHIDFMDLE